MNIRNIIFVNLLLVFKLVSTKQDETTVELNVARSEDCVEQIKILLSSPKLLRKFTEAGPYIPRNIYTKEPLEYPGEPSNCLSIDVDINGTAVQGQYAEVTIEVPTHSDEPPDFETLQNVINRYEMRKPYRLYYGIGCKGNFPPKPQLQYENTTSVTLGVCIPRPCSTAEAIDIVLDTERRPMIVNDRIIKNYSDKYHGLSVDKPFTTADYCFTIVMACVMLLATVSTLYDVRTTPGSSTADSLYRSFSIHKNARQLLRVSSSKDTVECVDGIRAIAMVLIIWLHCYTSTEAKTYKRDRFDFQLFFRPFARYGVDTFFLLGGIFNVYSVASKFTRRTFLKKLHLSYMNRLMRLYPVLCFEILAQTSIMNHFSDDPMVESCQASWWIVLLFIQNIIYQCGRGGSVLLCSDHTWYLSVDMQLFLVSTLVLMWMFKEKTATWIALSFAVILSLTCSTIFSFLNKFPFNFSGQHYDPKTGAITVMLQASVLKIFLQNTSLGETCTPDENMDYLFTLYFNIFTRASPYFIGMMVGYILHCSKNEKPFLNTKKLWIWSIWCLAMLIFSVIFAVSIVWTKEEDQNKNQLLHNVLNSYWYSIWSIALGWLIVACHHGHGGLVNWFLSLKQWKLLSRLSYSMYVLHMPIVRLINDKSKVYVDGVVNTTDFSGFKNFLCAFVATLVISFLVTILIEAPVLNLYRLAQGKEKRGNTIETKNQTRNKPIEPSFRFL